jgi:hypothetical protein
MIPRYHTLICCLAFWASPCAAQGPFPEGSVAPACPPVSVATSSWRSSTRSSIPARLTLPSAFRHEQSEREGDWRIENWSTADKAMTVQVVLGSPRSGLVQPWPTFNDHFFADSTKRRPRHPMARSSLRATIASRLQSLFVSRPFQDRSPRERSNAWVDQRLPGIWELGGQSWPLARHLRHRPRQPIT